MLLIVLIYASLRFFNGIMYGMAFIDLHQKTKNSLKPTHFAGETSGSFAYSSGIFLLVHHEDCAR